MIFFETLSELIDGYTVQLTIRKNDDGMTVMVVPTFNKAKDEVKNIIEPLIITGKSSEIDTNFFTFISEGLRKSTVLQANVDAFNKSLEKASKKAKSKISTKEKADKKSDAPKLEFNKKQPEKENEKSEENLDEPIKESEKKTTAVPGGNPSNVFKKNTQVEENTEKEPETKQTEYSDSSNDDFGDEEW